MNKTICTRCGKREGFRESFVSIKYDGKEIPLCAQCDQIPYKMKDAVNNGNIPLFSQLALEFNSGIKTGSLSQSLAEWFTNYKNTIYKMKYWTVLYALASNGTKRELMRCAGKLPEVSAHNYLYDLYRKSLEEQHIEPSVSDENLGVYYLDELGKTYDRLSDCP